MSNFIITYDLNGSVPTHAQMDLHLRNSGAARVARVLETVWYVQTSSSLDAVYEYVNRICSINDRVLVIDANNMYMRNLLVPTAEMQQAWLQAA